MVTWRRFYELHPFDHYHLTHRPAAMIAAAFGGKFDDRLKFLAPDPVAPGLTDPDLRTLAAFGITPPRGF